MSKLRVVSLLSLVLCGSAQGQSVDPARGTLEGFWQDTARRMLYSRSAPPSYAYGARTPLDQGQTYPAAKHVRQSGSGWEMVDLNFDDADYIVKTIAASAQNVQFIRTEKWSGCTMQHSCKLQAAEMICSLENVCPQGGEKVVDWRGEERYVRRVSCERLGRPQLQGIPVACR